MLCPDFTGVFFGSIDGNSVIPSISSFSRIRKGFLASILSILSFKTRFDAIAPIIVFLSCESPLPVTPLSVLKTEKVTHWLGQWQTLVRELIFLGKSRQSYSCFGPDILRRMRLGLNSRNAGMGTIAGLYGIGGSCSPCFKFGDAISVAKMISVQPSSSRSSSVALRTDHFLSGYGPFIAGSCRSKNA